MATPRKLRSHGSAENIDLDHPLSSNSGWVAKLRSMRAFNVEEQLSFYCAYHFTRGNKIIHFIFVPILLW